eukprot:gene17635-17840_t
MLRLAMGLTEPLGGRVALFGEDLADADAVRRRLLRSRCGLALQGGSLLAELSVEDNMWLALGTVAAARARLQRRLDRVMFEFGIEYAIVPRGRTLLLLTQDAALAARLCDRVLHLVRGRLVQHGPAEEGAVPAARS